MDASLDADGFDDEGYFRTGDLGIVRDDDHVVITGRLKDVIIRKGENISAKEVEDLLFTHPKIADAAVIGLPDDDAGEIPAAYVVLRPDTEATAEEIQEFVAGQVANYKQIRKVTFLDAVPKSASGKILRRVLRDEAAKS
jgi:4-coumarate--CoA ligase